MSFWEHLEELRTHIIRSVLAILVFGVLAFLNRNIIFDIVILGPSDSDFITFRTLCRLAEWLSFKSICLGDFKLEIISIKMAGQFMSHLYISIVAGIIAASPYIISEIWRFIVPALKPVERKYSLRAILASSFLFLTGIFFAYFVIVPLAVYFFATYQVSEFVQNQIQLDSYISTVITTTLSLGLVFEMPVLVYFLTRVGILSPAFLKRNRKVVIVLILLLAAIITPPDIFSQVIVSIPLVGLYEISILISARLYRKMNAAKPA